MSDSSHRQYYNYETTYQAGFCDPMRLKSPIARIQVKRIHKNNSNNCIYRSRLFSHENDNQTKNVCPNCINSLMVSQNRHVEPKGIYDMGCIFGEASEYGLERARKREIMGINNMKRAIYNKEKEIEKRFCENLNKDKEDNCKRNYKDLYENNDRDIYRSNYNTNKNYDYKEEKFCENLIKDIYHDIDWNLESNIYERTKKKQIKDNNPLSQSYAPNKSKIKKHDFDGIKTMYNTNNNRYNQQKYNENINKNDNNNQNEKPNYKNNGKIHRILSQSEFFDAANRQREFLNILKDYNDIKEKEDDKKLLNYRLGKENLRIKEEKLRQQEEKDEMLNTNKKLIEIKYKQKYKNYKINKEIDDKMIIDNYKEILLNNKKEYNKKLNCINVGEYNLNKAISTGIKNKMALQKDREEFNRSKGIQFDEYNNTNKCTCDNCCKNYPKNVMTKMKFNGKKK